MSVITSLPPVVRSSVKDRLVPVTGAWSPAAKFWFRVVFIFVVLFSIPLDIGFYKMLYHIDYAHFNYRHLTEIVAFFNPQFINKFSEDGFFGAASYINIPFVLLIALVGAGVWTATDKKREHYRVLYYWARVLARYRVAYAAIGWGYKKLFVMQMPRQHTGLWHTELIDFFAKRLYWEAISIVPVYEVFLGFAEWIGGFLLLFRRTAGVGAAVTLAVFGNIALSNHAYDIGEHVPSACMALLSVFILSKDIPAVWKLLVKEQAARSIPYYPVFTRWQRVAVAGLKYAGNFVFVFLFFLFEVYAVSRNDFYKIPNTPGLAGARGFYNVTLFKLNGKELPYTPFDTVRWQDATFEDWSSISYKVANRPQAIEPFAAGSYPRLGEVYDNKWHFDWRGDVRRYGSRYYKPEKRDPGKRDINIDWEQAGMAGRQWYFYKADTIASILQLQNKNSASRQQTQTLHYSRPAASRIILDGINEFGDSVYIVLDKTPGGYPLHQSGQTEIVSTPR